MRWLDKLKEVSGKDLIELKEMVQASGEVSRKKSPGVEKDLMEHDDDENNVTWQLKLKETDL